MSTLNGREGVRTCARTLLTTTAEMASAMMAATRRRVTALTDGQVWIAGSINQQARAVLEDHGWVVNENTADQLRFD